VSARALAEVERALAWAEEAGERQRVPSREPPEFDSVKIAEATFPGPRFSRTCSRLRAALTAVQEAVRAVEEAGDEERFGDCDDTASTADDVAISLIGTALTERGERRLRAAVWKRYRDVSKGLGSGT